MSAALGLHVLHHGRTPAARPAGAGDQRRLIDSHGRAIRDLRLSITDRCNFRCVYCMNPDVRFAAQRDLLSVAELLRLARLCIALGVERIRLTGGEPTLHPELDAIIAGVAALGVSDLSMTTNGSLIESDRLIEWKRLGLRRLTFSLDSIRPEVFAAMTRSRTAVGEVAQAIRKAKAAGLEPVKVNAVVVRGWNEGEVAGLARLAAELDFEMRFIEYMPLDSGRQWEPSKLVPAEEILIRVREAGEIVLLGKAEASSTSDTWVFEDGRPGRIGVIAPVTRPFCGACSRLRITADGKIRPCLFSLDEFDLRAPMRAGADDAELQRLLLDATWGKQAGHGITSPEFQQPDRPMSAIGG